MAGSGFCPLNLAPIGLGSGRNQCLYAKSTNLVGVNAQTSSTVAVNREIGETSRKSFADVSKVKYGRNIDTSELPTLGRQGDYPTIQLIEEEVDKGIQFCSMSLVGRIDLKKLNLERVQVLVKEKWNPKGKWQVTPLGRGYLMFRFEEKEDFEKTWGQGSWLFDTQVLRLSKWTPNFSTEKEPQSHAAVWVRFPGLGLEYWEVKNLMAMGKAFGRPIHVDETTAMRKMGYFASVLVDIDLSKKIPDKLWVESKKHGVAFWQTVQLGKTLDFCSHCKGIGHTVVNCRFLKSDIEKTKGKEVELPVKGKEVEVTAKPIEPDLTDMSKAQRKRWRKQNKAQEVANKENQSNNNQGEQQKNSGGTEINVIESAETTDQDELGNDSLNKVVGEESLENELLSNLPLALVNVNQDTVASPTIPASLPSDGCAEHVINRNTTEDDEQPTTVALVTFVPSDLAAMNHNLVECAAISTSNHFDLLDGGELEVVLETQEETHASLQQIVQEAEKVTKWADAAEANDDGFTPVTKKKNNGKGKGGNQLGSPPQTRARLKH